MAIFSAISYGIGYAVGFLGAAAGLSTATIMSLATAATSIVASTALNLVARALAPRPNIPTTEIQALINQTDAPRRVYVGQALAGGVRALWEVRGATLHQLVVVAHGPISEFVQFRVDGDPVTVSGGAVTSGRTDGGYLRVQTRDGTIPGGLYPDLMGSFSSWGSSRRLDEQATFWARMKAPKPEDFQKMWPKSYATTLQWVIRGQKVFDYRTGVSGWSGNAALVIAHYLTHPDGFRLPAINADSVAAMADVCDLPVRQMAGGTAPNLRLWGYWTLDEEPSSVLDRMHTSSGIRPYEMQDGSIGLIGGGFGIPACTLTAKDIEEIQTSEAISEREGYNVLQVFHMQPAQKYEVMEVAPWRDEARLAIEGEIAQEYRLEMCPNTSQARRLAKRQMHDDNRAKVTIITNLVGLKARWPRHHGQRHTIMLDYRPEDGSGRVVAGEYEVLGHELDPVSLKCRIELGRVDRWSDEWDASDESDTTADLPGLEPNPAPPMVATLSQRVVNISAGTAQASLEIVASEIEDREDLTIEAQYRKVGAAAWVDMTATENRALSGAVEDGETYEARVRWRGVFDEVPIWTLLGPVTVQIDATPPAAPTELIPSPGSGYAQLTWRNPTGAFQSIRVYRGTSNIRASATLVQTITGGASGQIADYQDAVPPGTYSYWVAAANVSGVEGPAIGPAQVTIT